MTKSKRSAEVVNRILCLIRDGTSLREACKKNDIAPSSFIEWTNKDKILAEQYARARDVGVDIEFEKFQEIADNAINNPERDAITGKIDPAWVSLQKLKADNMKWALSKRHPTKYGDKVDIGHTGGLTIELVQFSDTDRP